MGHPQPQTPMHVDSTTCVGIVNTTIKRQQSCAMEMRYFWLLGQTTKQYIKVHYQPGAGNMGNYPSKEHTGHTHKHVRPYFIQMANSPRELPQLGRPNSQQGCVETLEDPYSLLQERPTLAYSRVPLP